MPNKREAVEMILSWLRVFAAATLAQLMAGVTDWRIALNSGLCAVLPIIIRWLDKNDPVYGRGSQS